MLVFGIIWLRAAIRNAKYIRKSLKYQSLLHEEREDKTTLLNQLQYNRLIIILIVISLLYHFVGISNMAFFVVYAILNPSDNRTSAAVVDCGYGCMFISGAPISMFQLYYLSFAMIIAQIWSVYKNKNFNALIYCSVFLVRTVILLIIWTITYTYLFAKVLTSLSMAVDIIWIAILSINTYKLMNMNLQLRVSHFRIHLDDDLINSQRRTLSRYKLSIFSFYPLFLIFASLYIIYLTVSIVEVIEINPGFIRTEYGKNPNSLPEMWKKFLKDFYGGCNLITDMLAIIWDMPFLLIGFTKLKGIYQLEANT